MVTCFGEAATIVGTGQRDTITGTEGLYTWVGTPRSVRSPSPS